MRRGIVGSVLVVALVASGCGTDEPVDPVEAGWETSFGLSDASLRTTLKRTWIHGMTGAIANTEVGVAGVPTLVQLMNDPTFTRRDNVVAMLGFLADDAAVDAMIRAVANWQGSIARPADDRALLLLPHALGHAAARGHKPALDFLMAATAHGSDGGPLKATAALASDPYAQTASMIKMAMIGLRETNIRTAIERLQAIEAGRVVVLKAAPVPPGLTAEPVRRGASAPKLSAAVADGSSSSSTSTFEPALSDSQARVHDAPLTYANHPAVTSPMGNSRLDDALARASLRAGRGDHADDVACCITVSRSGNARVFGQAGDGLDVLGSSTEMTAALNDPISRVKVVRNISWCGSPGTNIIGCAWTPGNGMTLVRMTDLDDESVLWLHEYGHNTGLNHSNDSRAVMYGTVGTNDLLTAAECNTFHSPSSSAAMNPTDTGVCMDGDSDAVQDGIDNCPTVANADQLDSNSNGVGDACEVPVQCGDGTAQLPEECDGADLSGLTCANFGCSGGSLACTSGCTIDASGCTGCPVCNNNSTCDAGEDCTSCPGDCASGSGAACGNGVCEAADGENCLSCPSDCRGKQNGKPNNRFCCGNGAGEGPVSCGDSRCSTSGWQCSNAPAVASCCGDGTCEGSESSVGCAVDCPVPVCGDATCNGSETQCTCPTDCGAAATSETSCTDNTDNDCDGQVDCNDSDCAAASACSCGGGGASCTSASDCCSFKCKGKSGSKTCN